MILHRYVVARVIWTYMLSIAITYFITLCLFPGLESEIRNPTLGEWLPILIMAIFNMSDFVGKVRQLQKEDLSNLFVCTYRLNVKGVYVYGYLFAHNRESMREQNNA